MSSTCAFDVELFQICYSPETAENIPQGMNVLDNLSNSRPDWREYWPIRQFLLNTPLKEKTLYGFFSPKFQYKTGLSPEQVRTFVKSRHSGESVVSFSPYWDMSSFFVNVIEQGDYFHHGLRDVTQAYMTVCGHDAGVIDQFMHSGNTIFCNYLVADRDFWMKWLEWGEMLFAMAENKHLNPDLKSLLCDDTNYGEQQVPRKVFVMERLASLLLAQHKNIKTLAYDMFMLPAGRVGLQAYLQEAVCCDALKQKWDQSLSLASLNAFIEIRDRVFKSLGASQRNAQSAQRSLYA